ncbi:hypothetical protein RHMOL_Rhmol01G0262900 [Rhododendron molle]|uniref:Uncharacterized protein n=1 Tax=Rhododendron molle TaxID=49168 RepID=A0ACC0Q679_RHOML|nr:hypothetical protein RHMOL_Rhmol01G0262900 [Rhododendron molle]
MYHVQRQLLDSSALANADTWLLGLGLAIRGYRSQCTPRRLGYRKLQVCRFAQRINSLEPKQVLRCEELRGYYGGLGYKLGNLAILCDSGTRGTLIRSHVWILLLSYLLGVILGVKPLCATLLSVALSPLKIFLRPSREKLLCHEGPMKIVQQAQSLRLPFPMCSVTVSPLASHMTSPEAVT